MTMVGILTSIVLLSGGFAGFFLLDEEVRPQAHRRRAKSASLDGGQLPADPDASREAANQDLASRFPQAPISEREACSLSPV